MGREESGPAAGSDPPGPVAGPECPACGCRDLRVDHTRRRGQRIVRIRYCRHCGRRVITVEKTL